MEQESWHQQHPQLKLKELNSHLVCAICSGYLVDATTIVECLHSFCRSCLTRHIVKYASCPSCDAPLPKAKPFLHIRSDKTLQDIVYKLVPGLYHSEMQRRRDFYAKNPDEAWRASPEERGTAMERLVFSPQDQFSLSLEYCSKPQSECRNDDWETGSTRSSTSSHEGGSEGAASRRYVMCPALFTVGLLKKFLRLKYELKPPHKVDVFHRRVCLPDDYTIMDVAYIYSWRQTSPMRFLFCIYDEEKPVLQHPKLKQCENLSLKKRPSIEVSNCASESVQEAKTVPICAPPAAKAPKVKLESVPEIVPQKPEERIAVVVTQNENEHPVISIPSPPPSSESTPELDLLDMIDKNLSEETALANNNNNNNETEVSIKPEQVAVVERPKTPVKPQPPVSSAMPSSLSVSVSTPLTVSTTSVTSPSKSKARSPGNGPSILTIASELARKQQEQLERERERELLTSRAPQIVPSVSKQNQVLPSARLGTGKSSLEIKLVSSSAATKPCLPSRPEPFKPQTSITLKSNPDKEKTKPLQSRVAMETLLSTVPQVKHHNLSTFPRLTLPPQNQKATAKRPNQPYKFHNYEDSLLKAAKDDGAKKQKLEEPKCAPMSSAKNSHKLYHSSSIAPFSPVHKPAMHPLSIATPPPKQQRPASLSSTSSPSPSPPSTDMRHYSPPQQPKKSPTIEPPLSPVMYNGLLTAARHPSQSLAAALLMRQQIEYQKLYSRPEWAFSQHFMHHSASAAAAANTIKRLNEDYMRSLYSFGVASAATIPTTSTTTPLSSSNGNSK